MKFAKKLLPYIILLSIVIFFFNKSFFKGLVPFPGALLVSEYQPFRSYSYLGYAPGAVPNKAQYFDTIREFYPWRTLVNQIIIKGELPLWNPYNFSGSPLLANYQTAVFYPFNSLYLIFNQLDAWTILIILQPLLASFFTYLYAKKLGIKIFGAVISAIAFAYSSYMNVWLEFNTIGHTILWLPLTLLCIEEIFAGRKRFKFAIILFLSLTFSLFAGHPIDFAVAYLFTLFYVLARIVKLKKPLKLDLTKVFYILPPVILPLVIGSIQILPTVEFLQNSTRAPFNYDFLTNNLLVQPYQLIMMLIPDFFGNPATRNFWLINSYVGLTLYFGLIPLVFATLIISQIKKISQFFNQNQIKIIRIFTASIFILLLLTVRNPISLLIYKLNIPIISTNSPTKLFSIFLFSASVLAGFGLDIYIKEKRLGNILKPFLPIFLIFLFSLLYLKFIPAEYFKSGLRNLLLSFAILIVFTTIVIIDKIDLLKNKININTKKVLPFLFIFVTVFDLYYTFNKFNPFSPKEFIFPKVKVVEFLQQNAGINRFWGYGTAKIDANIATQYEIFSADGFDALNLSWYNQFLSSSNNGKIKTKFSHVDRSIAEIAPGYGETDMTENKYRKRVLDALGVKYILDRIENPRNDNTFPVSSYKRIWEDENGWIVYENLSAAPRFLLSSKVIPYSTNEEFEKTFFSKDFDPKKDILLKKEDVEKIDFATESQDLEKEVSLINYTPNKIEFFTNSTEEAFLFLSDTFDSGWEVYVDREKDKIYLANYAFRAVFLPAGEHKVVFVYRPSIFKLILKNIPKSL